MRETPNPLRWRRPLVALAVFVGCWTAAGVASADDPPKVRIVPDVSHPSDAEHPDATVETMLDGPLPASQPFSVEVAAADARLVGAIIDVWPSRGHACAEPAGPQNHRFAMTPSGTGADRVMTVRIPPLQVAQDFCVRLTWRAKLDAASYSSFVNRFKQAMMARLETRAKHGVTTDTLREVIPLAAAEALKSLNKPGSISNAAAASLPVQTELEDWLKARAAYEANEGRATAAEKKAQSVAAATPLPPAWLLDTPTRVLVFDALPEDIQADVDAIARVMTEVQAAYSTAEQKAIQAWVQTLRKNAAETDKAKRVPLPSLPKPKQLLLPGFPTDQVIPSTSVAGEAKLAWQDVARALDHIAKSSAVQQPLRQAAGQWKVAFDDAVKIGVEAGEAAGPLLDARRAAGDQLVAAIDLAIRADDRLRPDVNEPPVIVSAAAGEGVTPSAGNYVTPAVGVAVTIPLQSGGGRAWVFPHFGLNFYARPVDRTIPVGDLIDQFWQRVSLVAAISLKDIDLPTNSAESVVFGGYPYLGLGVRVTQFVQLHAGAAIYRYHDPNPGSSAVDLGCAPGAGVSVDLDVLSIAKTGISSL